MIVGFLQWFDKFSHAIGIGKNKTKLWKSFILIIWFKKVVIDVFVYSVSVLIHLIIYFNHFNLKTGLDELYFSVLYISFDPRVLFNSF